MLISGGEDEGNSQTQSQRGEKKAGIIGNDYQSFRDGLIRDQRRIGQH